MKDTLKHLSFRLFRWGARAGLYVAPAHYYVPLANPAALERTRSVWARKSDLPGVETDLDTQVALLQEVCRPYREEYAGNPTYLEAVKRHFGPGYGYVEAQALHAVVRHYRPRRVIEVGSGVSTVCILRALERNEAEDGQPFSLTCVEPYPTPTLQALEGIRLVQAPVQTCPLDLFDELGDGDLLFIDSSHTVRPGSDVNHLILEVLPRLAPGVLVHVHDIYFPYDYPRDVLKTYFQWMESSLLRAYLTHNTRDRILFCLSQLHYDRQAALKEVFPDYVPAADDDGMETDGRGHFPASLYLRTG